MPHDNVSAAIFPHIRIVMGIALGLGITRLLTGTASGGAHYSYAYDPADNIGSVTGPSGTQTGAYNAVNQVTSFGGQSYVYDANGNVTDDGIRLYKWDAEDRLVSVTLKAQPSRVTTFRYDGLRQRAGHLGQNPTNLIQTDRGVGIPLGGGKADQIEPVFESVGCVDGDSQVLVFPELRGQWF